MSPNLPQFAQETKTKQGLDFYVLGDAGNAVGKLYALTYQLWDDEIASLKKNNVDLPSCNGYAAWELPVTGRYVIRPDGVIQWAFCDLDHSIAPDPAKFIEMVKLAAKP